ncbi:anti-virulence regulator CigR family protein [uncultured Parvibaculum sp.]|mgnify:CR=1 FL=1|uniref:anti-virulence regulator CigR family protein n=1 Tax=uncultured Parvibaculum sp. TaxID=291828 RepID=UPI0030D97235
MTHAWKRPLVAGVTLALALAPASAFADPPGKMTGPGKGNAAHGNPHAGKPGPAGKGKAGNEILDASINVRFSTSEADIIRNYFGAHPAETKPLPPGIARNLQRGKPLPPGIAKRYLPSTLKAQLPARDGYERLLVGNDVLLVKAATGIIVDVLTGIR